METAKARSDPPTTAVNKPTVTIQLNKRHLTFDFFLDFVRGGREIGRGRLAT